MVEAMNQRGGAGPAAADTAEPADAKANAKLIFTSLDADNSGALDANELLAAVASLGHPDLDLDAINMLIREADLNGDGEIQPEEFEELLVAPPPVPEGHQPHLCLNFDVNQTVMILDSAIKAEPVALLSTILSNCCWGRIEDCEPEREGSPSKRFALVSESPSLSSPESGLKTYMQFVVAVTPIEKGAPLADVKAAKAARRTMLQSFTHAGQPGAALSDHMAKLQAALELPHEVRSSVDNERLTALGLTGGAVMLLPSFLRVLRHLKKAGRSFSVCFRTFGKDLPKLVPEYNALCSGNHPLFADEPIVLDGSDGGCDWCLKMGAPGGCGTWVRRGTAETGGADGSHLLLVLGSIEQPPIETARSGIDDIRAFYAGLEGSPAVEIIEGATAAAQRLRAELHVPGCGKSIALRDYYPGWEASGCRAEGGKPLLIEPADQNDVLQIFFDDHINAHDAHIVDVRRVTNPSAPAIPIGAVLGSHLVRAEPLLSIGEPTYFIDAIADAEAAWRKACRRRAVLAEALRDRGNVLARIERLKTSTAPAGELAYVPHAQTAYVQNATNVNVAEDDENA